MSEGEVGTNWNWYRSAHLRQLEESWRIMVLLIGMSLDDEEEGGGSLEEERGEEEEEEGKMT